MSEKKTKVLIVDDEPEIVTLLKAFLEKSGFEVLDAANGELALKYFGIQPFDPAIVLPDIVILDIMMPVMDGYALNAKLQADPRTAKIPIVVLTAKGQKMRELFEMAPNVAAYVQKPFNPKILRDLLINLLSGKK
jgi:two-component system alkaline phosphatase synthesis response regulator PhoP